jgi:hypothetical protein
MPLKVFPRESIGLGEGKGNRHSGMPLKLSEYRSGKHRLKVRRDIQDRYKRAVAEIAKIGGLSENQLRDLLMDPARGYNIGRGRAFHYTPLERLKSILKEGIVPRINENPTSFSESDMLRFVVPESVTRKLPRVFVEIAEDQPSGSNLPTSLWKQKLGLVSFPIEEAIKRLSKEDAFRILASELGRELKYPVTTNPISRIIIRQKAGIDPQRGSNPARRGQFLDIPEWALSEAVPAKLLTRMTNVNAMRQW